jgi:hypothetical protein
VSERFAEEEVHAGLLTSFTFIGRVVGGQCHDLNSFANLLKFRRVLVLKLPLHPANLLGSLKSIHNRHVDVHENELEGAAFEALDHLLYSFLAISGALRFELKVLLQNRLECPQTGSVVINYENLLAGASFSPLVIGTWCAIAETGIREVQFGHFAEYFGVICESFVPEGSWGVVVVRSRRSLS